MAVLERLPGLGHELRQVHVLAVGPESHEDREPSRCVGAEHVRAEQRAVAHRHRDIFFEQHGPLSGHGSGFAATSTNAITQGSSLRLLQAWRGPRRPRPPPPPRRPPPPPPPPPASPRGPTP